MISESQPDNPIQRYRKAAALHARAVQCATDARQTSETAEATLVEAREVLRRATTDMHAFILSTNATPQE